MYLHNFRPSATPCFLFFFFSSRRRHTRCLSDWSSDVCSSDLRAPPRATTLLGVAGKAPRSREAPLRWRGADELVLEVPLEGNETALTTVELPCQGAVAL